MALSQTSYYCYQYIRHDICYHHTYIKKLNYHFFFFNLSKLYKHFNTYPCGNNNDKLENYTFTPLCTIKRKGYGMDDDLHNEYLLCKEERHYQAMFGTIHYGLNGTADWNN